MRKVVKKGSVLVGLLLGFIFFATPAFAAENVLEKIAIHVQLAKDGSAIITEERQMNMQEGTELYITLNNLQDSELQGFQVDGFREEPNWDSDNSREEKAGRYGVLEVDNGYELIWGIGDYGRNQYILSYRLSNLVRDLEDGQGLLWNFDTFSGIPPEQLTLTIEGPVPFTTDNTQIWGFGFEGDIQLENGKIVWQSSDALNSANYATVLAQFPPNTFQVAVKEDMTLEDQRDMAQSGSAYNREDNSLSGAAIAWIASGVVAIAGIIIGIVARVGIVRKRIGQFPNKWELKKRNKNVVFEDVPYTEGETAEIAFLLQYLYAGSFQNYFFSYLLKWAKEEKIQIETTTTKGKFSEKEQSKIRITNTATNGFSGSLEEFADYVIASNGEETFESVVWQILLEAADEKGVITDKGMEKWAKKHGEELSKFDEKLKEFSLNRLEAKGFLTVVETQVFGVGMKVQSPQATGDELADRLMQFENYLNTIDLKEAATFEQTLPWEELVIWAALFGKAEELVKQLEKFFPEVWESWQQEYPYYMGGFHGYYGFYGSWTQGFDSSGYGSGGSGGSTSFGGGGGAGGGGGGGAR